MDETRHSFLPSVGASTSENKGSNKASIFRVRNRSMPWTNSRVIKRAVDKTDR